MMLRNYFIINMVLLLLVLLLGVKAFSIIIRPVEMPLMPEAAEVEPESISIMPKGGLPGEASYKVISDRNIFSPTRTLKSGVSSVGPAARVSPQDAPKLFGTIIIGSRRSALLKDSSTKATKNYYINDTVGDFTVTDIQESMVVLARGDEIIELKLRESKSVEPSAPSRNRNIRPTPKLQRKPPARVRKN